MALRRTTDAASELMTTAVAKDHLKEDLVDTDNDTRIDAYVTAGRQWMEKHTNRAFISQTWTLSLDDFPVGGVFHLSPVPVASITSVKYFDTDGTQQTLVAGTDYQVDVKSEPARVAVEPAATWPLVETDRLNAVEVIFVAGYGAASTDVPDPLIHANKMLLEHMYAHPGSVSEGKLIEVPQGMEMLLWPYRLEEA